MKITLDLNEKELRTIELALRDRNHTLWKQYIEEDSDMEKRETDSESVDVLCRGLSKAMAPIDGILAKLDDAEEAAAEAL